MQVYSREIGALQTNCYIYGDVIIDPGDDVDALKTFISETGSKPQKILLTHGHFDHILGAAPLKRLYGCQIGISEADAPVLVDARAALMGFECKTPFEPIVPDFLLESTDEYEIIRTPGHTKGSVSIYCKNDGILFSGDTLFKHGYGRTDFPGGSMMELVASLRRLFRLPDDVLVLPGHGERSTMGEIKKSYSR